jgi:hypothetical protein
VPSESVVTLRLRCDAPSPPQLTVHADHADHAPTTQSTGHTWLSASY